MKLFHQTLKLFFGIIHYGAIGIYMSVLFGVGLGLVLLPYAIGAHIGILLCDRVIAKDKVLNK